MQTISRRDRVVDPVHGHGIVYEIIPSRRRGLEGGNVAEVIVDFDDGTRAPVNVEDLMPESCESGLKT